MRTSLSIASALLASACASTPCPLPRAATASPAITLATYNVNFGLAADPETLAAIAGTRADVVLLQETNARWERSIRGALGGVYPHMVFVEPSDRPAGGSAILSRYPIESVDRSASAVGWFDALRAVIHTEQGALQVLNVHLKPPIEGSDPLIGAFTTPPARAREMRRHVRGLRSDLPTIVAGDFNEAAGGGIEVLARERGMRDAFGGAACTTWHWRVSSVQVHQQLDHVVHDERIEVLDVGVMPAGRSDHDPVVARLRLQALGGSEARQRSSARATSGSSAPSRPRSRSALERQDGNAPSSRGSSPRILRSAISATRAGST